MVYSPGTMIRIAKTSVRSRMIGNSSTFPLVRWALVVAVGLCSVALLGATQARTAVVAKSPQAAILPAQSNSNELLHDDPIAASTAAASVAPTNQKVVWMEVTAYCGCPKCCGPHARGLTASGRSVAYNGGQFVAADTRLFKFGTQFQIPGYAGGQPVEVIDRGSAIKGYHIDVFFRDHDQAKAWGRKWIPVTVVQ